MMSIPQGYPTPANSGQANFSASGGPSLPPLAPLAVLKRAGRTKMTDTAHQLMIELYNPSNAWQPLDATDLASPSRLGGSPKTIRAAIKLLYDLHFLEVRPSHTVPGLREARFDLRRQSDASRG